MAPSCAGNGLYHHLGAAEHRRRQVGWNEYNLRYVGAAANSSPCDQGSDVYDLAGTVEPGGTYNFSVPMIAPFDPGAYGEVWELVLGNQLICEFLRCISESTNGFVGRVH